MPADKRRRRQHRPSLETDPQAPRRHLALLFTAAGQRERGSTGERDRGRAEAYLAARWFEAHRKARIPVATGPGARLDLKQIAALWLAQLEERASERNPDYVNRHKLDVRYILGVFKLAQDATDDAWQAAMRKLHEDGLAWSSLRHATITLRHLLRFAASIGALPGAGPAPADESAHRARRGTAAGALGAGARPRVARDEGERRRPRAAHLDGDGVRRAAPRRGPPTDAALARPAREGAPRLRQERRARDRRAPPAGAAAVLAEAAARGVKDRGAPVFGGFDLRKAWKRALTRAKVDAHGLTAHHSARHTFGTLVAQESRGDVTAVQAALRHRSLAMSAKYVHASAARARAVIRRL
jgi:integrase